VALTATSSFEKEVISVTVGEPQEGEKIVRKSLLNLDRNIDELNLVVGIPTHDNMTDMFNLDISEQDDRVGSNPQKYNPETFDMAASGGNECLDSTLLFSPFPMPTYLPPTPPDVMMDLAILSPRTIQDTLESNYHPGNSSPEPQETPSKPKARKRKIQAGEDDNKKDSKKQRSRYITEEEDDRITGVTVEEKRLSSLVALMDTKKRGDSQKVAASRQKRFHNLNRCNWCTADVTDHNGIFSRLPCCGNIVCSDCVSQNFTQLWEDGKSKRFPCLVCSGTKKIIYPDVADVEASYLLCTYYKMAIEHGVARRNQDSKKRPGSFLTRNRDGLCDFLFAVHTSSPSDELRGFLNGIDEKLMKNITSNLSETKIAAASPVISPEDSETVLSLY